MSEIKRSDRINELIQLTNDGVHVREDQMRKEMVIYYLKSALSYIEELEEKLENYEEKEAGNMSVFKDMQENQEALREEFFKDISTEELKSIAKQIHDSAREFRGGRSEDGDKVR